MAPYSYRLYVLRQYEEYDVRFFFLTICAFFLMYDRSTAQALSVSVLNEASITLYNIGHFKLRYLMLCVLCYVCLQKKSFLQEGAATVDILTVIPFSWQGINPPHSTNQFPLPLPTKRTHVFRDFNLEKPWQTSGTNICI